VALQNFVTTGVIISALLYIAAKQPSLVQLVANGIEVAVRFIVSVMRAHAQATIASRAAYRVAYRTFHPRGAGIQSLAAPDGAPESEVAR
jgi:hypothetical protein